MSGENERLSRWRDLAGVERGPEARAAALVNAVGDVAALRPDAMARIKVAVQSRRGSTPVRGLPLALRFALLAIVLLASVATARGTMILWRRHEAAAAARRALTFVRHAPAVAEARQERVVDETPPPPAPAPEPAVVVTPRPAHAPVHHVRRAAIAAPPTARATTEATLAPGTSATEAQLLGRALSRLRQSHDPAGALALLDGYAQAYPHGMLAAEALNTRIEAVIQMDDRPTALKLLDERSVFVGRLGAQLLLTRAELRASRGRYADAVADFDRLLAGKDQTPAYVERALYGRSVCWGRLGHDDRARADLIAYQQRFPQGARASEVARLLNGNGNERRP